MEQVGQVPEVTEKAPKGFPAVLEAELIRADASPSTKKLQKLSNAAAKHKKNVPSMNTPAGFILGKASASEETPTFRGATTFRAPADDSLSPLIV